MASLIQLENQIYGLSRKVGRLQQSICCSGGGGGGLTFVSTDDSPTVTWSGNGTPGDPLIATVIGGGGTIPTLQEVTDEGNITTNSIIIGSDGGISPTVTALTVNDPDGASLVYLNGEVSTLQISSSALGNSIFATTLEDGNVELSFSPEGATAVTRILRSSGPGYTGQIQIVNADTTITNIFYPDGRISGANGTANTDFATYQQILTRPITGYTVGTNTALAATDTVLASLGKLQGQVSARVALSSAITGYTVGANTALAASDTILQAFGKTQGQINAKITLASPLTGLSTATNALVVDTDTLIVGIGKLQAQINSRAPLNNPALTGTPTAPTAPEGTNTTQIATTAFVQAAIPTVVEAASLPPDISGDPVGTFYLIG